MRDFRQRVRQRRPDREQVMETLRKGQLAKALRVARAAGTVIRQQDINATASAMFRGGRAGELLTIIGKMDVTIPYDVRTLLIRTFQTRDYHTFLKQVHRLGVASDHEDRIDEAIAVVAQRAPSEAVSWRIKLGKPRAAGNG